jgi:enoyl-CoA hydratase
VELGATGANLGPAPTDGPLSPFPAISKPLIGAINGTAATGGLELALACDILIASERARFADTHVRVGVHPAWGMTVLLPQRIGFQRARLMGLTGDFLDASSALAAGLVAEVVPHDALLPRARAIAAAIAESDPVVVRTILATERAVADSVWGEGLRIEAAAAAANRTGAFDTSRVTERIAAVLARGRAQAR